MGNWFSKDEGPVDVKSQKYLKCQDKCPQCHPCKKCVDDKGSSKHCPQCGVCAKCINKCDNESTKETFDVTQSGSVYISGRVLSPFDPST